MNSMTEDKALELAQKKKELLDEILLVAKEQKMYCLDNNFDIYNEFMERRNKCVEKLKKTDAMLQRYLKQAPLSAELSGKLEAISRDTAETIRQILTTDEINQRNLKQAMEMIKGKKGSLKANKRGVVKYYKTTGYPTTGALTDSKG